MKRKQGRSILSCLISTRIYGEGQELCIFILPEFRYHSYLNGLAIQVWKQHKYARATDEMKRQAQRKLGEKEGSVLKDDVAFKYADNEDVLKKLAGLK